LSISSEQCLAARAMLRLSRADVAKMAGVSVPTVVEFEVGRRRTFFRSIDLIRRVLEAAGVEFIEDGAGVRLRKCPPTQKPKQLEPEADREKFETEADQAHMLLVNIGERARTARVKANLTQAQVYERTGIAPAHLSQIELGRVNPSILTLFRLSKALAVDMKVLIS
jgi:transcriptional regulator with XRE-family HTH domain